MRWRTRHELLLAESFCVGHGKGGGRGDKRQSDVSRCQREFRIETILQAVDT